MRLTLRQLQIFSAIAKTGSTAAAAQHISLSQSAVSSALKELENILGADVFDRIGKRLVLNDNGRSLMPQALRMLSVAESIEVQFQADSELSVPLHLGASTTIGIYTLPKLLGGYQQNANLTAQVKIANTTEIVKAVAEFEVDLGLIEGHCNQTDLQIEPWYQDKLIIVASPQHPLAQQVVSIEQLQQARWLLREQGSGTQEATEQMLLPYLHRLQPAIELSHSEAIKQAAIAGLGIACLSHSVVEQALQSGELTQLHTPIPPLARNLFLIYHQSKVLSKSLQRFVEHCREYKAEYLGSSRRE